MARKQKQSKPGLSLPGLIDIIFLLLVFAIVKLIGYQNGTKDNRAGETLRTVLEGMPNINVYHADNVGDITTLTVQIENFVAEDATVQRRMLLLKGSRHEPVSYGAALISAAREGRSWTLPEPERINAGSAEELVQLEPFNGIRDSLLANIQSLYSADDPANFLEVRAIEGTEYMIVDFLLKTCAALEKRVPLFSICVLHEQGA